MASTDIHRLGEVIWRYWFRRGQVSSGNIAALRPHIKALVEATNKNDGCDLYEVAEDLFDPGLLRFSEIWPDQASFSRHISAPHIVPWREAGAKFGLIERSFKLFDGTNERPL